MSLTKCQNVSRTQTQKGGVGVYLLMSSKERAEEFGGGSTLVVHARLARGASVSKPVLRLRLKGLGPASHYGLMGPAYIFQGLIAYRKDMQR